MKVIVGKVTGLGYVRVKETNKDSFEWFKYLMSKKDSPATANNLRIIEIEDKKVRK